MIWATWSAPYLRDDVLDDLAATCVLEVHVDVGHRHAIGVEEPLERQLVADRVDGRDAEGVRDDRARARASARRRDPLLAREPDEVGDDEEVARVAHRGDDAELVVQARLQFRRDLAVAPREPPLAFGPQPALDRVPLRHGEVRDAQLPQRQLHIDHLRDPAGVQQCGALIGEQRLHRGRRLQPEVARFELHPVGRIEVVARADAQQDVMRLVLRLLHVMEVVRDDQRQSDLRREPQQLLVEPALLRETVVLQFKVETVSPKDVRVLAGHTPREIPVLGLERACDLAVEARG